MSIVRVGSTKDYSQGWEAAFGRSSRKTKKTTKGKAKSSAERTKASKKKRGK